MARSKAARRPVATVSPFLLLKPEARAEAEVLGLANNEQAMVLASVFKTGEDQVKRLRNYKRTREEIAAKSAVTAATTAPQSPTVSSPAATDVTEPARPFVWDMKPAQALADAAIARAKREPEQAAKATRPAQDGDRYANERSKAEQKAEQKKAKRDAKVAAGARELHVGSDIEIAFSVTADLHQQYGALVFDDGFIYRYDGRQWKALSYKEERLATYIYDGAIDDEGGVVRLSKSRVDSILNEMRAMLTVEDFFKDAPAGINCVSGFIMFDTNKKSATFGKPTLVPHDRDHRCRHIVNGEWQPGADANPSEGTLLLKLIDGVFKGESDASEKKRLLRQAAGCAAMGYATKLRKPKCIILLGTSAENGKSQLLDLMRGVVPPKARSSLPAAKLSDQSFLVRLADKHLNATDELSGTAAIAGEVFKACVTGEPVAARDLYRSAIEFRPRALQFFATNKLPKFNGGFDRGVIRRLLLFEVNRFIPTDERLENIGQRIVEEEADGLLAWAVAGASDLIRERDFTVPPSCDDALKRWVRSADPVKGWVAARVKVVPIPAPPARKPDGMKSAAVHAEFAKWAKAEGYRDEEIPGVSGFVQRLIEIPGIVTRHTRWGNSLIGFELLPQDREQEDDEGV